jgi:hypothetical protein
MVMRLCIHVLPALVLLAPGVLLRGAEGPPARSPAEELAALKQEQKATNTATDEALAATKDDQARKKVFADHRKRCEPIVARAVELARKHPGDTASLDALIWVFTGGAGWSASSEAAYDLLVRDHANSARLEPICAMAATFGQHESGERFLRAVLQKSPHRSVRGVACASLAWNLKDQAQAARYEKKPDADRLAREAEALYERAAADYGDVILRGRTAGDRAKAALFQMRHLVVGRKAPDIEGEDIDGKRFKLSDYKGKVIVLDFWGHW